MSTHVIYSMYCMVNASAREIIHSLKLVDYLHKQTNWSYGVKTKFAKSIEKKIVKELSPGIVTLFVW